MGMGMGMGGKKTARRGMGKKLARNKNDRGMKSKSLPIIKEEVETPIAKSPELDLPFSPSSESDNEDDDATCLVQCKTIKCQSFHCSATSFLT